MVLIAAETKLALVLGGLLNAPPDCYAFSVEKAQQLVRETQPAVLLLDVKLGSNHERAVDAVPMMLLYSPTTSVVLVSKRPKPREISEATEMGAFGVVDRMAPDLAARVNEIVAFARAASRRERVQLPRVRLRSMH